MRRRSIIAAGLFGTALFGSAARADDAPASGPVRVPLGDGDFAAFQARPAGAGPFPCVIVAGDGAGTPEWVAEICRRLAGAGYLAIAPELWAGEPEPPDADVLRRLDAAFAWAGQNDGDQGRVGLAGFGRGGRAAWLYAAQSSALKAVVAWGGAVGGTPSPGRPKTPLDVAGELKAPLLGLFGKNDAGNPRALLLKAEAAGRATEIVVYTGAAASFAQPGRPSYDPAAALDGWNRMLAWFKRHGVA